MSTQFDDLEDTLVENKPKVKKRPADGKSEATRKSTGAGSAGAAKRTDGVRTTGTRPAGTRPAGTKTSSTSGATRVPSTTKKRSGNTDTSIKKTGTTQKKKAPTTREVVNKKPTKKKPSSSVNSNTWGEDNELGESKSSNTKWVKLIIWSVLGFFAFVVAVAVILKFSEKAEEVRQAEEEAAAVVEEVETTPEEVVPEESVEDKIDLLAPSLGRTDVKLGKATFSVSTNYSSGIRRTENTAEGKEFVFIPVGEDTVDGDVKYNIQVGYFNGMAVSAMNTGKYSSYDIVSQFNNSYAEALNGMSMNIAKLALKNGSTMNLWGCRVANNGKEDAIMFTGMLAKSGDMYVIELTIAQPSGTESGSKSYKDAILELQEIMKSIELEDDEFVFVDYSLETKVVEEEPEEDTSVDEELLNERAENADAKVVIDEEGIYMVQADDTEAGYTLYGYGADYQDNLEERCILEDTNVYNKYIWIDAGTTLYLTGCKVYKPSDKEYTNIKAPDTSNGVEYSLLGGASVKAGSITVTSKTDDGKVSVMNAEGIETIAVKVGSGDKETVEVSDGDLVTFTGGARHGK